MTESQTGWDIPLEELGLEFLELRRDQETRNEFGAVPREARKEAWDFIVDRYKKGCEMTQEALS